MTPRVAFGFLLTLLAGSVSGNSMLPLKMAKQWPWEAIWLVFSIVSLAILPWTLAIVLVRHLFSIYAALPLNAYLAPLFFGVGWGVAQVLFGLSISRLGMALSYAIIVGLGALFGALVPLVVKHRTLIFTGQGVLVLTGIAIMVGGIVLSATAGLQRERGRTRSELGKPLSSGRYWLALTMAITCGLMAPMLNYSFAFGQSIADQAIRFGSAPEVAGYSIWPIALSGGLIPNSVYAVTVLNRRGTWASFSSNWNHDFWLGCVMGLLWMGALTIYGISTVYLGPLGTSAGWALFQIFMIMTANLAGVISGEWSDASRAARSSHWTGIALLSLASIFIAVGNR